MKVLLVWLFSILLVLGGVGCSKDQDANCPVGEVRFVNNSKNPYSLEVSGRSYGSISGGTYKIVELREGNHSWYVVQQSGYLLYPTERYGDVSVFGCDEYIVNFP